jgi:hypothetical protein
LLLRYSPLPTNHIRVAQLDGLTGDTELQLTSTEIPLGDPAPYDAISYAWNDEHPTVAVQCNGAQFSITPSLEGALRSLTELSCSLPVWADATCIDQANDDEKSCQVPLMRSIYANARIVTVWLGPGDE